MLLNGLMEEKQLNFDQPLLSVRRYSSTVASTEVENKKKIDNALPRLPRLPVYKPELKSGPLRNPGTIPFVWERTPGRPKDENVPETWTLSRSPVAPKLPPGRVLNVKKEGSDKCSQGNATRWSQARNDLPKSQIVPSSDKTVTKEDGSREGMEEPGSSDFEDSNEAYVDAVDTLSRSESFFMNCSFSGVSGLDGPDLKTFGNYSTDPFARDFMIGRFLPAAKAMASETLQHSTRRQPEQPRQIKIVSAEKRRPLNQYGQNYAPYYGQGNGVEESDDEDDYYDGSDGSSLKVCGLFPRLCLQNSFCLLNPVPGMRKQGKVPITSVRTRKLKPLYASTSETENKGRDAVYEKRTIDDLRTKGTWEDENELKSGFNQTVKYGNNFRELLARESNNWKLDSGIPVVEKTLYVDSVHSVKPQDSNPSSLDLNFSTGYARSDTELLVKSAKIQGTTVPLDSSLRDIMHLNAADEKPKVQPESLDSVDCYVVSLSDKIVHDLQMGVPGDCSLNKELMKDSTAFACPGVNEDGKTDLQRHLDKISSDLESSHEVVRDPNSRATDYGLHDLKIQHYTKSSDEKNYVGYSMRPLPPPLPKSPSESWLKRTLPVIASRNSSSRPPFGLHLDPHETLSLDPKWETIVKTANLQHGLSRFSEDLLVPIPET